jgi:Protein of unknown function (DUF2946)
MRWIRSRCRYAAGVALFALALQFALSFGHTHALPTPQPTASLTAQADDGSSPPGNHDDDNYCSICAVLALLTNTQTASAPVVAPPVVLAAAERPSLPETILSGSQRAAFRSRAPPQA